MLRPSAVAALLVLCGCGGVNLNLLRPGGSESLVSTRVCGVFVDGKTNAAHLRIDLVPTGRLQRGAFVEAEFENPVAGGKPLVAGRAFNGESSLSIFSPPLKGVRPRSYEVVARVYASAEKKQVLGVHTQVCQALIDQRDVTPGASGSMELGEPISPPPKP